MCWMQRLMNSVLPQQIEICSSCGAGAYLFVVDLGRHVVVFVWSYYYSHPYVVRGKLVFPRLVAVITPILLAHPPQHQPMEWKKLTPYFLLQKSG
jgi:hypothetical protein